MKCSIMLHFIRVYAVKVKRSSDKRIQCYLKIITWHPRYVQWTIPSLVYQTKRKNPLVYKGLSFEKCYHHLINGDRMFLLLSSVLNKLLWSSIFEPQHEISNNVVCATSKASDHPAHKSSLIRACFSRLNVLWLLSCWLNIILCFLA